MLNKIDTTETPKPGKSNSIISMPELKSLIGVSAPFTSTFGTASLISTFKVPAPLTSTIGTAPLTGTFGTPLTSSFGMPTDYKSKMIRAVAMYGGSLEQIQECAAGALVNGSIWKLDEKKKLIDAVKLYGRDFKRVSEHVGTRDTQ